MLFKTQKQLKKECEKEYSFLEDVLIAHDNFKYKLYLNNIEDYHKYENRVENAHKIADVLDSEIIKPFMKNSLDVNLAVKNLKNDFMFACAGASTLGIEIGSAILLNNSVAYSVCGGLALASSGLIGKFLYKYLKNYKLKLAQINTELRWNVLKYLPCYTEGFLRVNNIKETNVFDEKFCGNFEVEGGLKELHDPLKEDEKTRKEIIAWLKLAHLDQEYENL